MCLFANKHSNDCSSVKGIKLSINHLGFFPHYIRGRNFGLPFLKLHLKLWLFVCMTYLFNQYFEAHSDDSIESSMVREQVNKICIY